MLAAGILGLLYAIPAFTENDIVKDGKSCADKPAQTVVGLAPEAANADLIAAYDGTVSNRHLVDSRNGYNALIESSGEETYITLPEVAPLVAADVNHVFFDAEKRAKKIKFKAISGVNDNYAFANGHNSRLLVYSRKQYGKAFVHAFNYLDYNCITDTYKIPNIVSVKKTGPADFRGIQEAIDKVPADAAHPYRIDIYDDWIVTNRLEYTQNIGVVKKAFIKPKAHTYLNGAGARRHIDCSIPESSTNLGFDAVIPLVTCGLNNLNISMKNGGNAIHPDAATMKDATIIIQDCAFTNWGHADVIAYRKANNLVNPPILYADAVGMGTHSGVKILFYNCSFSGRTGFFIHNNINFTAPHFVQFNACSFEGSDQHAQRVHSMGSGQPDINEYNLCRFNMPILYNCFVYNPDPSKISYLLNELKLTGKDNVLNGWKNACTGGGSLKITSAAAAGSVEVAGGSAADCLLADPEKAGNYSVGRLELGEWPLVALRMGSRLGDCSSAPKSLRLLIDGAPKTITFDQDFTAQSNARILSYINEALADRATASLFQRAAQYDPSSDLK
jgi:hypothetical protein